MKAYYPHTQLKDDTARIRTATNHLKQGRKTEEMIGYSNEEWFNVEQMKRQGTCVFGNRGTGKSNLLKWLVRILVGQGVTVKVFDPSQTHIKESDIEHYQIIRNGQNEVYNDPQASMIFDTSRLYPEQQQQFIQEIMNADFQHATEKRRKSWLCFVIEECQLVLSPSMLRSKIGQEALRWVTVGRNFKLTYIIASQRPSTVDTTVISLTGSRYFGQLDEPNDLAKLKKFIRDKTILNQIPYLKVGQFVVKVNHEPQLVTTPPYEGNMTPTLYEPQPPKKKGFLDRLFGST